MPARVAETEVGALGGAVGRGAPGAETPHDVRSLVEAARSGDRAAFARLFERFAPMVHGVALARGVGASEAEDVVQEVFVLAIRKLGSVREVAAVGGWLAAAARSCAADHRRRERRAHWWTRTGTVLRLARTEESPAPSPEPELSIDGVLAAIRRLPEAYREPLVLRLVEGMTGPQMAARMGMTHGSVRVNLHKGMAMLREDLGDRLAKEGGR